MEKLIMFPVVPSKGLEGVVATRSSISWIDGAAGVLSYRVIDIHELADHSTFEETTSLLWSGTLPAADELAAFSAQLAAARVMDPHVVDLLRSVPTSATPMQ